MTNAIVSAFYSQPWKILPVAFQSSRCVCFGEDAIIEFDFPQARVTCIESVKPNAIATLETPDVTTNSIAEFRGVITGKRFSISVTKGGFLGSPTVLLTRQLQDGATPEARWERVEMMREFDWGMSMRCRYLDGQEKLEIWYEDEEEAMAQVLGAVLLHLLMSGGNTRG